MKLTKLIVSILILINLVSCGQSEDIEVLVSDSEHTIVNTIELGFIDQLLLLCSDLYLPEEFNSYESYKREVSTCVFSHLDSLGSFDLDLPTEDEINNLIDATQN